jgi:hypothetical protein
VYHYQPGSRFCYCRYKSQASAKEQAYEVMRAGRVEEADALARLTGKEMKKQCISSLSSINYKTDAAKVWSVVRELTGKPQSSAAVPGITADILNRHYAAISTDSDYHNPAPKLIAAANTDDVITEWQVFKV